jgi:hypothetical protein
MTLHSIFTTTRAHGSVTSRFLTFNINRTWIIRREKVVAINDACTLQRNYTATRHRQVYTQKRKPYLTAEVCIRQTWLTDTDTQGLKDDGTVNPAL